MSKTSKEVMTFNAALRKCKEPYKSYVYLRHSGVNAGIACRFASLLNDATVEAWQYEEHKESQALIDQLVENPFLIEKRLYETEKEFTQAFLMTQLLCETALRVEDYAMRNADGQLRLLPKDKQKNGGDSMLEGIRFDKEGNIVEIKRTRSADLKLLTAIHLANTPISRVSDHEKSEITAEIESFIKEGLKKSL